MIERSHTCISLFLRTVSSAKYDSFKDYENLSIVYECGLLDIFDSSIISHKSRGKLRKSVWYDGKMGKLINYKELNTHKCHLLKNNKLTIVVFLDIVEDMKLPLGLNAMSKQFEKLFTNKKFSDFALVTSEEREIPVHKNILSIRCEQLNTFI